MVKRGNRNSLCCMLVLLPGFFPFVVERGWLPQGFFSLAAAAARANNHANFEKLPSISNALDNNALRVVVGF